jgi:hypothetical protein
MKTLKEFMQENNVTAFETVNDLILNVVVDQTSYGLNVDTSNISAGTVLTKHETFTLNGDLLTVDNITIDTNEVGLIVDRNDMLDESNF